MIDYPRLATARPAAQPDSDDVDAQLAQGGFLARRLKRVSEVMCRLLHGHDLVLHFEQKRVCLRCTSCTYHSPGWEMDLRRPQLRFRGDRRRHLLTRRPTLARSKTA
ncbi:MAG: hypothetical protein HYX76_06180 [Acidobacteria bacterium]|nr:hypothetical protein [Acidobacteriota bacterium]